MAKVLQIENNVERYKRLADARAEKEDFFGALTFLFSAEKEQFNYEILMRIADAYADMGNLELSNKYWFKYMHFAPSDKVSVAYEELAVNYFYMENLWASGYYFHKKISKDGYISKEGLDKEILDFFSGEEFKRHAYRIVYPRERADYTFETKNGKRAIALGGFKEATIVLEKIPEDCRTEEISGDLAVAYFMDNRLDDAEKVCRHSLNKHGETVTAYANLSTVYDMRGDFLNSEFYYQKALACRKGNFGEAYKIATCSIEREDHETAKECLETILKDRPYETSMCFFYGIALINLGDYEGGYQSLKKAYMIDPDDLITEYYLSFSDKLRKGGEDDEKLLPLKYQKELPKKISVKWSRRIKDLVKTPERISVVMKKPEMQTVVKWGMLYGTEAVMRASALIASSADGARFKRTALSMLLTPDVRDGLKRLLVYVLIMKGHKGRIGVVASSFYTDFSAKKLQCEKTADGALYFSAYALLVSRLIFFDIEGFERAAKITDKIYRAFSGVITEAETTNEEIAALILSECGFEKFSTDQEVLRNFEITESKFKQLKNLYENSKAGEKND